MSARTVPMSGIELIDRVFGRHARGLIARQHALNLRPDEFKLAASLHGMSFVTTLNRSRRLAHFEHCSYSIWRRELTGPRLVRIVAQGLCGQWIMQAQRADWLKDDPRCAPCERSLRDLVERYRGIES